MFALGRGRFGGFGLFAGGLLLALSMPVASQPRPFVADTASRHLPNDGPQAPYAMNYADEAAQTLGIVHGQLNVFSLRPSRGDKLMPNLSGGIDRGGVTLKLQWWPVE